MSRSDEYVTRVVGPKELLTDASNLIVDNWNELERKLRGTDKPDIEFMHELMALDALRAIVLYYGDAAVGYALLSIQPDLYAAGKKVGFVMALYCARNHRNFRAAKQLLDAIEHTAVHARCSSVFTAVRQPSGGVDYSALLKRRGYAAIEVMYRKRLSDGIT